MLQDADKRMIYYLQISESEMWTYRWAYVIKHHSWSRQEMEESGQLHASAPLLQGAHCMWHSVVSPSPTAH
jgi:hypothetical protein